MAHSETGLLVRGVKHDNCENITGYAPDEILGRKLPDFFVSEQLNKMKAEAHQHVDFKKQKSEDHYFKHKDGSEHWYSISCSSSHDIDGNEILICHARNIDDRKEYEEKLQFLSTHDQLTGAYNRRFFDEFLDHQSLQREYPLTLIVCDIDKLKKINDTYGHSTGDRIIILCAQIIQNVLRNGDYLARTGGDEFVAVLPAVNEREAEKIVGKIKEAISSFNQTENDLATELSLSVGSATASSRGDSVEDLFKRADARMYEQKR